MNTWSVYTKIKNLIARLMEKKKVALTPEEHEKTCKKIAEILEI